MVVSMANKPYTDTHKTPHTFTRVFPQHIDVDDLEWHRDVYDRTVTVVESKGWRFQHDNDVPFELTEGLTFQIKAGEFHRIIKGDGQLIVDINEHP